jgi:hypothetical protein
MFGSFRCCDEDSRERGVLRKAWRGYQRCSFERKLEGTAGTIGALVEKLSGSPHTAQRPLSREPTATPAPVALGSVTEKRRLAGPLRLGESPRAGPAKKCRGEC